MNKVHGSPYDRGSADAYYRRPQFAHKWPQGTGNGQPVTDLSTEEIEEYNQGYADQIKTGEFKDWGNE